MLSNYNDMAEAYTDGSWVVFKSANNEFSLAVSELDTVDED